MKVIKILILGTVFSFLTVSNSFAGWFWTPTEVDCTATLTYTMELEGVSVTFTETWEGKKRVCRDGTSWCWASDCS
jgi:hypothetical protein